MIRLDSILDTEKGKNEYPAVKEGLLKRFVVDNLYHVSLEKICKSYHVKNGYGTNTYTGVLREGVEVSELELAMICDNGYSFFGGSSRINEDRSFQVEIWFD
ncbi:hypothetical protein [Bacillus sp. 1P02SD]|uniref:hypothetical protein n=1 Tax=Bacillus sp. 1P02SD TaxID=3132264 RepID=UPI0039A11616